MPGCKFCRSRVHVQLFRRNTRLSEKNGREVLENCRAVKKSAHRRRMTAAGLWAAWRRRRRPGPWVWELPEEPERRSGFRRCLAAPSRSWPGWSRTSDGLKQDWLFEMKEATQKNGANDFYSQAINQIKKKSSKEPIFKSWQVYFWDFRDWRLCLFMAFY